MATPEFLSRWRSKSGTVAHLARITLPRADGTQTDRLYLSMSDQSTYADSSTGDPARLWMGAVKSFGSIHMPGSFGSTDLHLATSSLVLRADHQVVFPAGVGAKITETIRQSMATHVWLNATVSVWRYIHDLADFKHAQCVLDELGVLEPSIEDDELTLSLRQMLPWNKPLTSRTVNRQEFPRAPDSAVGLSLPIIMGDLSAEPMRRPWAKRPAEYSSFPIIASQQERFAGAILADPGRGGQATQNLSAKVYAAGHAVKSVQDAAGGVALWMDTSAGPAMLMDPVQAIYANTASVTPFNTATGAGVLIPDDPARKYALLRMVPADAVTVTNSADNIRNILDPSDSTFVFFDFSAGKSELRFTVVPPENIADGTVIIDSVFGYQTEAGSSITLELDANNVGSWTLFDTAPPSTTPSIRRALFFASGSVWPDTSTWVVRLRNYAGKARIWFFGFVIYFRPRQEVVQSDRIITTQELASIDRSGSYVGRPYDVPVRTPAVTEVVGKFFSCPVGAQDSGGTYTGSGTSLIERAPDLMMYLLVTYGAVALADIERGATSFGSFVYARTLLQSAGVDPVHAFSVTESTDLLTALLWLSADSMTKMMISPYDGKFRLIPWRTDPAVDYPILLSIEDVNEPMGPDVKLTPTTNVVTDVRVSYGYDARERSYRTETSLAPDRSTAGFEYRSLRDQNMIVVAGANDRLDFRSNSAAGGGMTVRVASLTPGVYVPQSSLAPGAGDTAAGFAQQLKLAMKTAEAAAAEGRYQVTWGTAITTGYNYQVTVIRNSIVYNAFLPANDGTQTCEQLAAAVQTTVNAATSGVQTNKFFCYYDRATNKYAVYVTEAVAWKIKGTGDGSDYTASWMKFSGWASLGFYQPGTEGVIALGLPGTFADDVRIEDHFAITNIGGSGTTPGPKFEFDLLFQSGTNGADSATAVRYCADLLGFAPGEDKLTAFTGGHSYVADCPKGNRETAMNTVAALYGRRREVAHEARTIQRGPAARSLRNKIADLFRAPRPVISFTTRALPDIEQGQVFGFREEMPKPYPGPGSNGLWIGKRFVVVEYTHDAGPSSLDTYVVAVDAGALAGVVVAIGIGIVVAGAFFSRFA